MDHTFRRLLGPPGHRQMRLRQPDSRRHAGEWPCPWHGPTHGEGQGDRSLVHLTHGTRPLQEGVRNPGGRLEEAALLICPHLLAFSPSLRRFQPLPSLWYLLPGKAGGGEKRTRPLGPLGVGSVFPPPPASP